MTPDADHQISVVPVEGGWRVLSPFDDTPLMFLSGAKAEELADQVVAYLHRQGIVGAAVDRLLDG